MQTQTPLISRVSGFPLSIKVNEEERPTAEQVIEWVKEQAYGTGELGLENHLIRFEDYAELLAEYDPFMPSPTLEDMLELGSQENQRADSISRMLAKHPAVVQEAEMLVEKRLVEAGMDPTTHSKLLRTRKKTLQRKVIKLYELVHPIPKQANMIHAKLCKQVGSTIQLEDVWIKADHSLEEVRSVLRLCSNTINTGGQQVQQGSGIWSYDLHSSKGTRSVARGNRKDLVWEGDWRLAVRDMKANICHGASATFVQV